MASSPFIWRYGQHWLSQTEPAFMPGQVAFGPSGNELLIHAELSDSHVMQDVFPFNFPAFMQCDAFEIFLGTHGRKAAIHRRNIPDSRGMERRCPNPARRPVSNIAPRVAALIRTLRLHPGQPGARDLVHLAACRLQFPPERRMAAGQVGLSFQPFRPLLNRTSTRLE